LHLGCGSEDCAVAERPMAAASCTGSAGAHVGAPEDDGDIVYNDEPTETPDRD
jgi:hypothetical protein